MSNIYSGHLGRNNLLFYIFIFALIIRIAFLLKGAELYYGSEEFKYLNNDSHSYSNSFLNLLDTGYYTHNPNNPEAAYGRLPGYPFFWGVHFLILGPDFVNVGVAITQILLDSLAIFLVFGITSRISKRKGTAYLAAFLYACYPFIIIWTTITGTEALASFFTLLFFYCLFTLKPGKKKIIILSICLSLCFYIREYLGILIISAFIYFYFEGNFFSFLKKSFGLGLLFFLFYLPWPIRNYLHADKIILLKTKTAGYDRYTADVNSCRSWIYCWTPEADYYLNKIADSNETIVIPANVLVTKEDRQLFRKLVQKSRACGSGFYYWENNKVSPRANCNSEIQMGFDQLKKNYIKNNPLSFLFRVPFLNLKKALFKNELTNLNLSKGNLSLKSTISPLLFTFRTLLLIIGLVGAGVYFKDKRIKALLFFFAFIYIFICCILRQVEMRYLLQADIILLIPAALFLEKILFKAFPHAAYPGKPSN